MKKTLYFIGFTVVALTVLSTYAHAAVTTTGVVAGASATTVEAATPTATSTPETITAKKAKAQADLGTIETQFRLFADRTQTTIDRLHTKGVDTVAAQDALDGAVTALDAAKVNLNILTNITVTDDMSEKALAKTDLKSTLIAIQTHLTDARTYLISSLSSLKTAVSVITQ